MIYIQLSDDGQHIRKFSREPFAGGVEYAEAPEPWPSTLTRPIALVTRDVLAEVDRAVTKFPTWPTDPLHALAVLGEEFGELTKDVLQAVYEPNKRVTRQQIEAEAIQTAAMALRFVASLDAYLYRPTEQHEQRWSDPLPLPPTSAGGV